MIGLSVREWLDDKKHEVFAKKVEYQGVSYFLGSISGNEAELFNSSFDDQPMVIVELELITFI